MTQTEAAQRLGVKQQTISALERNAETVSAERLLRLLNVLGVELVMRKADPGSVNRTASRNLPGKPWVVVRTLESSACG